jgi:trans-aconitate methyltransferase
MLSRKELQVEGVELSKVMISKARSNLPAGVELHCNDGVEYLSDKVEQYNGVFAIDLLEHLETDDVVLDLLLRVHRALVPGGFFAVRVPNMVNFSSVQLLYKDATHERGYTETSILHCMEAAGFEQCQVYGTLPSGAGQRLRGSVEKYLHKLIYRICGTADINVFSRMLYCVVFKGGGADGPHVS